RYSATRALTRDFRRRSIRMMPWRLACNAATWTASRCEADRLALSAQYLCILAAPRERSWRDFRGATNHLSAERWMVIIVCSRRYYSGFGTSQRLLFGENRRFVSTWESTAKHAFGRLGLRGNR